MTTSTLSADSSERTIDILLVEDNPGDAKLVETYLRKADPRLLGGQIRLEVASTLATAIDKLGESKFETILLDLGLPESRGLDTLDRMMAHTLCIPIVILNGSHDDETSFEAVRRGADDFLYKDELSGNRLARSIRYAIERYERNLRSAIIDSADFALMLEEWGTMDPEIIFVNQACESLTGYSQQQWRRTGLSLLNDSAAELEMAVEKAISSGERGSVELYSQRSDGSSFWNKADLIPLQDHQERITHILYSLQDITEQIRWRERMADIDRMSTLGTVSAGIAHEINNPLAFISANVEFALQSLTSDDATEEMRESVTDALNDAMEGSRRVRDIVRDLRQLAGRPDAMDVAKNRLCISEPIRTALTIARIHIKDRARLRTDFADVPEIIGDDAKLSQVFLNLLINAAHAISGDDPESDEVHVSTFERGEMVGVCIRDTGHGISGEDQKRVFKPFYSSKTGPREDKGSGLGLSISKRIVHQFGGTIELDSTLGEGTSVRVLLPKAPGQD